MNPFESKDEAVDFGQLKEIQHFNKNYNNELWETIDLLKQTTEQLLESQANNQNQIKQSLEAIRTNSFSAEYANLKEHFHELQTLYNELNKKYEKTVAAHLTEIEDLQKHHKEEIEILKAENSLKNCEYEDTLGKLKEELEVKEEEYLHDIHASQAESALRFDEMESRLQKMLDESNKKIRELNNSNSVLRSEMMTLKSDFGNANMTKIQELESRLILSESQRRMAEAKLQQRCPDSFSERQYKSLNTVFTRKTKPVTFIAKTNQTAANAIISNTEPISASATINLYKETKKTSYIRTKTEVKENLNIPPLQQMPNTTSFANPVKRRKLYTLNDVENLENPD